MLHTYCTWFIFKVNPNCESKSRSSLLDLISFTRNKVSFQTQVNYVLFLPPMQDWVLGQLPWYNSVSWDAWNSRNIFVLVMRGSECVRAPSFHWPLLEAGHSQDQCLLERWGVYLRGQRYSVLYIWVSFSFNGLNKQLILNFLLLSLNGYLFHKRKREER